jgi:hypothetical protein
MRRQPTSAPPACSASTSGSSSAYANCKGCSLRSGRSSPRLGYSACCCTASATAPQQVHMAQVVGIVRNYRYARAVATRSWCHEIPYCLWLSCAGSGDVLLESIHSLADTIIIWSAVSGIMQAPVAGLLPKQHLNELN